MASNQFPEVREFVSAWLVSYNAAVLAAPQKESPRLRSVAPTIDLVVPRLLSVKVLGCELKRVKADSCLWHCSARLFGPPEGGVEGDTPGKKLTDRDEQGSTSSFQ